MAIEGKEVRKRKGGNQHAQKNGKSSIPKSRRSPKGKVLCGLSCLSSLVLCLVLFLYVVLPAAFYYSPTVRRYAVFLNFVSWPPGMNLSNVESFGFDCSRNLYLESEPGVQLGLWHVVPSSRAPSLCPPGQPKGLPNLPPANGGLFQDDRPIILYVHGNSGTRGGGHRVDLYKKLTGPKVDAHLITFDYRGYGDSTWVAPTVDGVVKDAKVVYNWLVQQVDPKRVTVWGHSLGTGVTVQLLDQHQELRPAGVVLETPFTTLSEVAYHHPLTVVHRRLPYFEQFFIKPAEGRDTYFNSETRIQRLAFPLLILHAEDDGVVPFEHGQRLYMKVKQHRQRQGSKVPILFKGFSGNLGYGHKYILQDPELPQIINDFIHSYV